MKTYVHHWGSKRQQEPCPPSPAGAGARVQGLGKPTGGGGGDGDGDGDGGGGGGRSTVVLLYVISFTSRGVAPHVAAISMSHNNGLGPFRALAPYVPSGRRRQAKA